MSHDRKNPTLKSGSSTGICQSLSVESDHTDALYGACCAAMAEHPTVVGFSKHGGDKYLELHFTVNANTVPLAVPLTGSVDVASFCETWLRVVADYNSAPQDDGFIAGDDGDIVEGFQAEVGGAMVGDQACAIRVRPWWIYYGK